MCASVVRIVSGLARVLGVASFPPRSQRGLRAGVKGRGKRCRRRGTRTDSRVSCVLVTGALVLAPLPHAEPRPAHHWAQDLWESPARLGALRACAMSCLQRCPLARGASAGPPRQHRRCLSATASGGSRVVSRGSVVGAGRWRRPRACFPRAERWQCRCRQRPAPTMERGPRRHPARSPGSAR